MDYEQSTSIVVLGALAAIVLTTVGSTVDIGSPHVALAAAAATSHFRHFVTTIPSHFRQPFSISAITDKVVDDRYPQCNMPVPLLAFELRSSS
jgi:hypothetical protein